ARRMSYNLEAAWLAAYIKTSTPLSPAAEKQLAANLTLARSLGAEVVTTAGDNIPEGLLRLARQRNVTQIVVGKTQHNRLKNILRGGSPTERLIRASGDIDVVVVSAEDHVPQPSRVSLPPIARHSTWRQYALSVGIIAAVTAADLFAPPWFSYLAVGLTELFAVLLIAVYIGRGPALLAASLSALSWNFLFIEPRLTFSINQSQDVILFALYFIIALYTGNLTARLRQQEQQARYNNERNLALYRLAHDVSAAVDMDDVVRIAVEQIGHAFDSDVGMWLSHDRILDRLPHGASTLEASDKEFSVASWAFDNGKSAGRGTDTLPLAAGRYFPLMTTHPAVGVLGIQPRGSEDFSFEQQLLLETFVTQIALAVEREMLDQAAEQAAMLAESERLYTTLLNSISHELRTPITAISGLASNLTDPQRAISDETRIEVGADIQEAADRLNRLVENLLDMSRLDSGQLHIKRDWCDVCELFGSAVNRMKKRLNSRLVSIVCAPGLPLIPLDFVLIEQALVNLIDNACAYTPQGAPITLAARVEENKMYLTVEDRGPGIPPEKLDRIFDKFYRIDGTATGGTGLGLSITEGIVSAHDGTIRVENALQGGARFIITLPLSDKAPQVREADL
ncbi:MAG: DUF4118 domain-containing protein, partial [Anaerolineae bacterium]|nr:DUF4118 domain-containing protein [Anaerolineae bacterium]